jgi:hypothetical protein
MKQIGFVHIEVEKKIALPDGKEDITNIFTFGMPMGAPLADASDAAFKIFKTIDKMYRDAMDQEIKKSEEDRLKEDKKEKEGK